FAQISPSTVSNTASGMSVVSGPDKASTSNPVRASISRGHRLTVFAKSTVITRGGLVMPASDSTLTWRQDIVHDELDLSAMYLRRLGRAPLFLGASFTLLDLRNLRRVKRSLQSIDNECADLGVIQYAVKAN